MEKSFFADDPQNEAGKPHEIPSLDDAGDSSEQTSGGSFTTDEGRLAAMMSYIPFLCFVPLLKMQTNPEARFHARQGVMLFLVELIAVLFLIDGISDFVFKAILILAVGLSVAGIYFALKGKNYRLPVIGDLADKTKL
jgi:uncharacterized membrane protein